MGKFCVKCGASLERRTVLREMRSRHAERPAGNAAITRFSRANARHPTGSSADPGALKARC